MDKQTISYYDTFSDDYISDTVNANVSAIRNKFIAKLPVGARILDFGCGSGRDSKAFLEAGYMVDATDGSEKMVRYATLLTGIPVRYQCFQELSERGCYDGIWACSSILHLPYEELEDVFRRMNVALKDGGIAYVSFKYGQESGLRNGRYFTDLDEQSLGRLVGNTRCFDMEEQWVSPDVRPGREEEKWLNAILRKRNP